MPSMALNSISRRPEIGMFNNSSITGGKMCGLWGFKMREEMKWVRN
jgi:hypothetical protein